jgi:hypothetical protein
LRTFQEPGERQFLDSLDRGKNRPLGDRPFGSSPTGVTGQDAGDGTETDREKEQRLEHS